MYSDVHVIDDRVLNAYHSFVTRTHYVGDFVSHHVRTIRHTGRLLYAFVYSHYNNTAELDIFMAHFIAVPLIHSILHFHRNSLLILQIIALRHCSYIVYIYI